MKRPKLLNEGSSRSHHSKTELLENDSQSQASEVSHDQPKSTSSSSDDDNDDYVSGDNKEAILARKLMQTIDKNYSKPLKDKITRLLLYILNFGYHVIKINEQGNVLIRNHLLGPGSNILDLLQASVTSCATKPVGFQQFRKSLLEINVPKNFLAESRVKSDKNDSSAKQSIRSADSKSDNKKITRWETY